MVRARGCPDQLQLFAHRDPSRSAFGLTGVSPESTAALNRVADGRRSRRWHAGDEAWAARRPNQTTAKEPVMLPGNCHSATRRSFITGMAAMSVAAGGLAVSAQATSAAPVSPSLGAQPGRRNTLSAGQEVVQA